MTESLSSLWSDDGNTEGGQDASVCEMHSSGLPVSAAKVSSLGGWSNVQTHFIRGGGTGSCGPGSFLFLFVRLGLDSLRAGGLSDRNQDFSPEGPLGLEVQALFIFISCSREMCQDGCLLSLSLPKR